jgi:hypothetical protein
LRALMVRTRRSPRAVNKGKSLLPQEKRLNTKTEKRMHGMGFIRILL